MSNGLFRGPATVLPKWAIQKMMYNCGYAPHGVDVSLFVSLGRCTLPGSRHRSSGTTESAKSTAARQWDPQPTVAPGSRRGGHPIAGPACCRRHPGCHRRRGCAEERATPQVRATCASDDGAITSATGRRGVGDAEVADYRKSRGLLPAHGCSRRPRSAWLNRPTPPAAATRRIRTTAAQRWDRGSCASSDAGLPWRSGVRFEPRSAFTAR